jgi:pimeloyl-ACP methyl ester carboxylesterase
MGMREINIGDIDLSVAVTGQGEQPLLLVHGFPLDHTMWVRQAAGLNETHRLIVPDLRGFGRSGVTTGTVAMEQFADDLATLLDRLEIAEPISLCGLSMGGYIAWQFWRRHADRLGRLILCDTRAAADTEEVRRARLIMAEQVLSQGVEAATAPMLEKLLSPKTLAGKPEIVQRLKSMMANSPPEGVAAAQRGMAARPDVTGWLGEIDLPTLVVCGEDDGISPPEEMHEIAAAMPRATFVCLAEAGHMSPLENPDDFNDALREFLK